MRLFSSFCAYAGRPTKAIPTTNDKIPFIDVLLLALQYPGAFDESSPPLADAPSFTFDDVRHVPQ
jgi:hypothetical protein